MIDYEEELKKFEPCLDVADVEGAIYDREITDIMDVLQAMPGIVLAIAISAALGPGLTNSVIALSISSIPGYARMTRASIPNVRKMEYWRRPPPSTAPMPASSGSTCCPTPCPP